MIEAYATDKDGHLEVCTMDDPDVAERLWIRLTGPDTQEIETIAKRFSVDAGFLEDPLDEEALSHVEYRDDGSLYTIIDVPVRTVRNGNDAFMTIPLSIVVTHDVIITSCLERTGTLDAIILASGVTLSSGKAPGVPVSSANLSARTALGKVDTAKKLRFVYQILLSSAQRYQETLLSIDNERKVMEERLSRRTSDSELIKLHTLEVDLIYYETSLSADQAIVERILGSDKLHHFPEDRDLLQDVVIETRQAREMATTYREILSGTRELFAAVLDNGLNRVMKILTGLTIILSVPMIIAGLYGMNVNSAGMPLVNLPYAFAIICLITLTLCIIVAIWLHRKDLL